MIINNIGKPPPCIIRPDESDRMPYWLEKRLEQWYIQKARGGRCDKMEIPRDPNYILKMALNKFKLNNVFDHPRCVELNADELDGDCRHLGYVLQPYCEMLDLTPELNSLELELEALIYLSDQSHYDRNCCTVLFYQLLDPKEHRLRIPGSGGETALIQSKY